MGREKYSQADTSKQIHSISQPCVTFLLFFFAIVFCLDLDIGPQDRKLWYPNNDLGVTNILSGFFLFHFITLLTKRYDFWSPDHKLLRVSVWHLPVKSCMSVLYIEKELEKSFYWSWSLSAIMHGVCSCAVTCKFTHGSHFTKVSFKCTSQILLNLK